MAAPDNNHFHFVPLRTNSRPPLVKMLDFRYTKDTSVFIVTDGTGSVKEELAVADIVLIVDDDITVQTMLYKVIRSNGLEAETAGSGEAALDLVKRRNYDLILLDVNMRGMDGFEVVQHLRSWGVKTPVIIVSGRQEDYDTLYGLDIGADDYVTKPFNPVVLGAKVKALIRRSKGSLSEAEAVISAGPFQYNTTTLRFYKNGQEIVLSSKENAMMKLFLDHVNRVFSKDMLYEMIWGQTIVDENAIMVYINRLRQKIEENPAKPQYIQTVRGLGYRFVV